MTTSHHDTAAPRPMRGYIEGYYGRLFDWQDRQRIIDRMAALGMSTYVYAPKEDPFHRVEWRTAWPQDWLRAFADFCEHARDRQIDVIGGIAPGLDYARGDEDKDFVSLSEKTASLARAGAAGIALMFDDIEPVSEDRMAVVAEMAFHGAIASRIADGSEIGAVCATHLCRRDQHPCRISLCRAGQGPAARHGCVPLRIAYRHRC